MAGWDMLVMGGWVMAPLLICSVVALTIIVERLIALRRAIVLDSEIVGLVDAYDKGSSPDSALRKCEKGRGPYARLIEEVLRSRHLNHAQVVEIMHVTGLAQVGRMERGLTVLEIIANVSPLIGLLGTVLGMVDVFSTISSSPEGLGNPQMLSSGIYQALITTIAGLSVAIPALAAHSWLTRRVEYYATEMQERATGFIAKLFTQRAAAARPPATAPSQTLGSEA